MSGRGALLRARHRGPPPCRRPLPASARAHRRGRRMGVARGLPAARLRHGGHDRGGQGALGRAPNGDNLFIKIPGTKEGLPAIEECIAVGRAHQRDPPVLGRPVPGGGRGVSAGRRASGRGGPRPHGRLGGVGVHVPVGHRRQRHRARRAPGPLGARSGAADLPRLPGAHVQRSLAAAGQLRGADPAAPVGEHQHQGSRCPRHPLRARPGRAAHREHDAQRDPRGLLRPRRGRGSDARRRWRRRRVPERFRGRRRRRRGARGQAPVRRRLLVRRRRGRTCWPGSRARPKRSPDRAVHRWYTRFTWRREIVADNLRDRPAWKAPGTASRPVRHPGICASSSPRTPVAASA